MKRLILLFCTFTFLLNINLLAQKEDATLRELFLDAEYFLLNEEYEEALSNYMMVYKRGYEDNGNINYRIGQCYLNIPGEKVKAISYLENAVQYANAKYQEGILKEKYAPFDAYYFLGNAYRINYQLEKAKASYEQFKTFYSTRDKERLALANKEIEACDFASEQIKTPAEIKIVHIGRPVSTNSRDIYPVVSGNNNSIVYISKQKFYDALFYSRKIDYKWTTPINITPEVQSDGDQYPTFLSHDGKELYLRKEDNFEADLLVSKNIDGVWTKSRSLGKNINSKYWEGNASVSKDGNTLYFSSNRKEGSGSMDLYKSTKQSNGDWGLPVNLGNKINTLFNEDAPYITEDGKRLYFISQGHKNIGGYDIFYSEILPDGQFSEPVHLNYPINTTDNDIYFYPVQNGEIAYTALTQKGNLGFEDIFSIYLAPGAESIAMNTQLPEPVAVAETEEISKDSSELVKPEATPAQVAIAEKPTEKPIKIEPEKTEPEKVVEITPKPEKSLSKSEEPIILHTIFFDFNSNELNENAKKMLDYLAIVLKNNIDIKIQFTGHTDAVGLESYNQTLSEKRAAAAKKYLVKQGISAGKISTKGMGESVSIAINQNTDGTDNAEGRKFNRRVDVQILEKKQDTKIVIEELDIPKPLKIEKP